MLGDFNARTGTLNDFIENDADDFLTMNNTYIRDKRFPKRNKADYTVNKVGGAILWLGIGNRLRILLKITLLNFFGRQIQKTNLLTDYPALKFKGKLIHLTQSKTL